MTMKTALVTGTHGFVGRNLCVRLRLHENVRLIEVDVDTPPEKLETRLWKADVIFHLAGVNRPQNMEDYAVGNAGFTKYLCDRLQALSRAPHIVFSSSIQADLDNPYGISKRKAEEELLMFAERTGATFCHNIAHDLPISISDPEKTLELVYIDDVCTDMMAIVGLCKAPSAPHRDSEGIYPEVAPAFEITLGRLADTIRSFRNTRSSLQTPAFDDPFIRRLYATYLSYIEGSDFAYDLDLKSDNRGCLAEFLKSPSFGQIFISRTKPGVTRGNHYHHTKAEKFLVVQGQAIIRFRHILGNEIIEHHVSGEEFRVVDIPPGYTHSIENVGKEELVTLFWADEIFDPDQPDTYYDEVVKAEGE